MVNGGITTHIDPHNFSTQYNLAKALGECNENLAALPHHELAIKLSSNNPDAWLNYGKALWALKSNEHALEAFSKALELKPNFLEAMLNVASSLAAIKEYALALAMFDKLLDLAPSYFLAWSNKGSTLQELKRYDDALACYEKALTLKPDFAEAWSKKGYVFWLLRKYDDAFDCNLKALELMPEFPPFWHNLGTNFLSLKLYVDALKAYDKVLSLDPDFPYAAGTRLYTKMMIVDWDNLKEDLSACKQKIEQGKIAGMPFNLLGLSTSEAMNQQIAKIHIQNKYPENSSLGPIEKTQNEKIKLGYFSADFKTHAVAMLIADLIETHDRDHFEVIGFSYGEEKAGDLMRERLIHAFDQFIDITSKSDAEAALFSRNLGIDIAIDLSGHTGDCRTGIFSFRAAPVQVNYLGYPGTMGAAYIDYIIADKTIIPKESEQFYSEKIVYLPHSYQPNDTKKLVSKKKFTLTELGLPEGGFIFCCFNNNFKITPDTLDSWARILQEVNGSILWLLEDSPTAANNLQKQLAIRGVDASRLIFAPRVTPEDHLARHTFADLFLDTLPYNAHTTASDALWMSLPVITLLGETFAGRVAASLLEAIDLPELITNSRSEYEALAIELARNPNKLNAIKNKLSKHRLTTHLFNTKAYAKDIEKAYEIMYGLQQADLPPQSFQV